MTSILHIHFLSVLSIPSNCTPLSSHSFFGSLGLEIYLLSLDIPSFSSWHPPPRRSFSLRPPYTVTTVPPAIPCLRGPKKGHNSHLDPSHVGPFDLINQQRGSIRSKLGRARALTTPLPSFTNLNHFSPSHTTLTQSVTVSL